MARGFSVISLLAALLIGGWLLTAQQSSPSRQQTTQAVAEAQQAAAGLAFQQAEAQLEQTHSLSGTYVRTSLAGFGVTLVRADASTYCIQNATAHLSGPGGAPASGPC